MARGWWILLDLVLVVSGLAVAQKRRCSFKIKSFNQRFHSAGAVRGPEQVCELSECCVGYFVIDNGELKADALACDVVEKSCSEMNCHVLPHFKKHVIKCLCDSDFCNSNINVSHLSPDLQQPRLLHVYDGVPVAALVMALILLCGAAVIVVLHKKTNSSDSDVGPLCCCLVTKPSEINIADIQLLQIVSKGTFATVWRGIYQDSPVAVKVFSDRHRQKYYSEKRVYELPLMSHAGLVRFIGAGASRGCGLIVLQYAKYGSLHWFLTSHSSCWRISLTMSQSLSQGLSHLHSDLHKHGVHKPSVAHTDLSSSNVLVTAEGSCVVCDFQSASVLCSCSRQRPLPLNARNTQVCTLRYMSPEVLEGSVNLNSDWSLQGDVYSLGLVLWEIWMRCTDLFDDTPPPHLLPYEYELGSKITLESLVQLVFYRDQRPSIPEAWNSHPQGSSLQDLLSSCWDGDTDARLSAACVVDRLTSLQSNGSH